MSTKASVVGLYPIDAKEPVYLVELEIRGFDGKFDFVEITQEMSGQPRSNWQVPYDEMILDETGSSITVDRSLLRNKPADWTGDFRIAFFFHYLDLNRPLKSPFGDLSLPPVTKRPGRLEFMNYVSPD